MLTVAYLANLYPSAVEPYVGDEIQELRRRGVNVISGSARRPNTNQNLPTNETSESPTLCLQCVGVRTLLQALGLIVKRWERISSLLARVLLHGKESPRLRVMALLHTWLGACYAVVLQKRRVDHIHVHHGYFGSWIAMTAARLLGISFSMTLHGSDLLRHGLYLDAKLKNCSFCVTISAYNRCYILEHFSEIDPQKIKVSRLGVVAPLAEVFPRMAVSNRDRKFTLLAVGRLHVIKNHAFLIRACARLRDSDVDVQCAIAGDGPERQSLELLIRSHRLQRQITLLGHVARANLDAFYRDADLVVLTSLSEGIPLVLMEAMARGKIVLAPAITGIAELVIPAKTGFLYEPGDLEDFVRRILFLQALMQFNPRPLTNRLNWIRYAARVQVLRNFSRESTLNQFANAFLLLTKSYPRRSPNENPLLQQI
jgi:colanic acid/amylovoran biosynthesis glycosyltransferase